MTAVTPEQLKIAEEEWLRLRENLKQIEHDPTASTEVREAAARAMQLADNAFQTMARAQTEELQQKAYQRMISQMTR